MGVVEKLKGVPFDNGAKSATGQYERYAVLPEEERKKGFVRPVRCSYQHVGPVGPKNPLRDLTPEEHESYDRFGYVKYEDLGKGSGMYWTQQRLDKVKKGGCGAVTNMGQALSETYARDPGYYGSTFCAGCGLHLPVGEMGEFVWQGTDERVGT